MVIETAKVSKPTEKEIEMVIEFAKRDLKDLIEGRTLRYREVHGNVMALVPGYSFAYLIALEPELAAPIRNIGKTIGSVIVADFIKSTDLEGVVGEIAKIIETAKLGGTVVTKISDREFRLRVTECADCGGTPDLGRPLCAFDEGLIEGTIATKLKKKVTVVENECVEEGRKYCDFAIKIVD